MFGIKLSKLVVALELFFTVLKKKICWVYKNENSYKNAFHDKYGLDCIDLILPKSLHRLK